MKNILMSLFALLLTVLVVQAVPYSYSYSSTIVGDVRIQTLNNGSLYCDSMICPQGAYNCKVTKQNDPNNFDVIVRRRRCYDSNGSVLAEEEINEPNPNNGGRVNMVITSGAGGNSYIQGGGGEVHQMTPEEQREFEERMRRTQEEIQNRISESMNQLYSNLGPFLDGSFATNLNNQIRSSFRNAFY
ncbi:uncharacterized protein LOC129918254 isoform X2 [Episyrphus balteatus]|uniref:uncharacterized protein LOC129918254 isoform X2 n=1 Tax=Episyrphus balteatus TaxID=286459 RepID=UPI00248612AA|nr:uncharacterized protein LOC129918254 isoform X2 [Episyrphus balteatus]